VRVGLVALVFFLGIGAAGAQTPPATAHLAVSTAKPAAQQAFDQGLTLLYAFNPEEARRRFERAAVLDPALAMAYWGIAMSWGVNINSGFEPSNQRLGREAAHRATASAQDATPLERGLIDAAVKRFAYDRKADAASSARAYRDAMDALARRFPDNDDLQALAVEATLDVSPWGYWDGGQPVAGIAAAIARLETVLKRDPEHIAANHFLIHALEESPHPERALSAAERLNAMPLEPAAEHLAHMPAHIFMQLGDYHAAGNANARALDLFDAYLGGEHADGHENYRPHDCTFAVDAYMMSGESAAALRSARRCSARLAAEVSMRFRRWTELGGVSDLPFAHGMAAIVAGHIAQAEADARNLDAAKSDIASIAALLVRAKIAAARGDRDGEIAALRRAVANQDLEGYGEPPEFFFPVRESLGGALLRAGRPADAERIFRDDLDKNKANPRSLYGLAESLRRQGRTAEADAAQQSFAAAWRYADATLAINDL
jgi:Tfp pilus assembly protein PilF